MDFLTDENVYSPAVQMLRELDHNVFDLKEKELFGVTDKKVFDLAQKEKRILITLDHNFGNLIKYPLGTHWGIIVIKVHPPSIPDTVDLLRKFLTQTSKEKILNALVIMDKHKVRIKSK